MQPDIDTGKIKVYVLSLARSVQRRRNIAEQLIKNGIKFDFVDAVDAADENSDFLQSHVDEAAVFNNIGRPLSDQEIACALTHRCAYQKIVDSKLSGAILLEDDVKITEGLLTTLRFFKESAHELASSNAIYHLGAFAGPYIEDMVLRKRSPRQVGDGLQFLKVAGNLSGEVWGAFGYYITAAAAVSLLTVQKLQSVADHWSLWAQYSSGHIFVSVPATVIHPADRSDSEIHAVRGLLARSKAERDSASNSLRRISESTRSRLMRYVVRPLARQIL